MALLICPVVILGVLAGLRRGPTGVALGYSVAMVLLFVPITAWAIHGTGITSGAYWDAIKRPLIAGSLAGGAGWLAQLFFQGTLTPLFLLATELAVLYAVYIVLPSFVLGQKDFYLDLIRSILRRKDEVPLQVSGV